jgi:hypothetical protein
MPLTDSPASLVRSLKGAPLACLFILLLSGDALRAGELCQATGYSPNSITAALRLLAHLNLIVKTPDGWRVTPPLRGTLLHSTGSSENIAIRDLPASIRESNPSGGEDINSDLLSIPPPPPDSAPQIVRFTSRPGLPASKIYPRESFSGEQQGAFTPERSSRDANLEQVSRILAATPLLFGERLHGPPSRYPDVRLLLAAIAEAYARRSSLRTPARVAYANLKRGVEPEAEFLADPLAHLPADFLAEAGLALPAHAEGERVDDDVSPDVDAAEDRLPASHPSLDLPADASARRSAAQVWEIAVQVLRSDLPRSYYRLYLESCRLSSFDPETAAFTIMAPGEPARLWLQDHLTARLTHLLNGICDRPCSVRFEADT